MAEVFGKRIVVEGVDAAGKSYQARRLHVRLAESGVKMANFLVDEPDGAYRVDNLDEVMESEFWSDEQKLERSLAPAAAELRKLLKSKDSNLTTEQNVELFTQSREINWFQVVQPALHEGYSTVPARSEASTVIYQGRAEGYGMDRVRELTMQRMGAHYMNPDMMLILDFEDEAERQRRMHGRDEKSDGDAFESRPSAFQTAIREGYRIYPQLYGGTLIPADGTRDEVHELIWEHVRVLYNL